MTDEEVRIRSMYLFLICSQAVEQLKDRLVGTCSSSPLPATPVLEHALRRELGMLFRYWTTRRIWERLESNEADAKLLNLALLRLFTNGFHLPRDGSGLRYAQMSTLADEVRELSHRITNALGVEHPPLLAELQGSIVLWRDAVLQYTAEALERPMDQLAASVKEWAERAPETPRDGTA